MNKVQGRSVYYLSVSIFKDEDDGTLLLINNAEEGTPYNVDVMEFVDSYGKQVCINGLKVVSHTEPKNTDKIGSDGKIKVKLFYRHDLPKI